jgi:hypothetical protein
MPRMGRPKVPAKDRSSRVIALRLTPGEEKTLQQLAKQSGLSVGDYIRTTLKLRGEQQ